jgi:transcriptional regulator with XRE-family HTH domain
MIESSTVKEIDIDAIHKRIGENVAHYRKAVNLSQLDLSLLLGHKSVSIVASAERYYNKKHFNINHLFQIAEILKVDICQLLEQDKKIN